MHQPTFSQYLLKFIKFITSQQYVTVKLKKDVAKETNNQTCLHCFAMNFPNWF